MITHLDGRQIAVKSTPGEIIKPESSVGKPFVKIIPGEGMPSKGNPFVKGNLYVLFQVEFPSDGEIDAATINNLKQMLPAPAMQLDYDEEEVEVCNLEHADVKNFGKGGASTAVNEYDSDEEGGAQQVQCAQS